MNIKKAIESKDNFKLVELLSDKDTESLRQIINKSLNGQTLLTTAVRTNNVPAAVLLLEKKADPNLYMTTSPLSDALAVSSDMTMAILLIHSGAKINMLNNRGETAIDLAEIYEPRFCMILRMFGGLSSTELKPSVKSKKNTKSVHWTPVTQVKLFTRSEIERESMFPPQPKKRCFKKPEPVQLNVEKSNK